MTRPEPQRGVLEIEPYVGGRARADGAGPVYKLSANETPLGPSKAAIEAFKDAATSLSLYPDGGAEELREAIAERYGLNPNRIVCGAGSDELLHLLAQCYLGEGDESIVTEHGFLVYPIVTSAAGAKTVVAKEVDCRTDVDAILSAVTAKTKVVFLANPNNPTGTYIPAEEVRRLQQGLRPDILLILDAAYSEYVSRNDYEAGIELVATCENVVMTRTFSKIYGLAGLRLGWMYAPQHIVDVVNRVRGPFNVSRPAMKAGVAAIRDLNHLKLSREHNDKWLAWLTEKISRLGLDVTPSVANFLIIHFPNEKGKTAKDADAFLMKRGLILRAVTSYGLPDCLRLTVGTEEANRLVVAALAEFMNGKAVTS